MGQALGFLSALAKFDPCGSWAKYVCNAVRCHSNCSECCDVEFVTDMVEVASDDSEMELEVIGCCTARKVTKENARSEGPEG